jgi:hypothetical protein
VECVLTAYDFKLDLTKLFPLSRLIRDVSISKSLTIFYLLSPKQDVEAHSCVSCEVRSSSTVKLSP